MKAEAACFLFKSQMLFLRENDDDDDGSVVCSRERERELQTGSVLLQYEVFQLICRSQQEGRRLAVSCDQLTHRRHFCMAELS